jgi:hypothetical protein
MKSNAITGFGLGQAKEYHVRFLDLQQARCGGRGPCVSERCGHVARGKPDTFVITDDINAMWLRDPSAQVQA